MRANIAWGEAVSKNEFMGLSRDYDLYSIF